MAETPKSTGNAGGSAGRPPRASRFRAGLPASILPAGGQVASPCTLANLSRSGALLARTPPLAPGARIDLGLSTAAGDLAFRLDATVARTPAEVGDNHLGVRFVAISPEQERALEALLSRIIADSSAGPLGELEGGESPARIREALQQISLAHRITLAARASLAERRLLQHDLHPQVLTSLVRNPRITVDEIQALLARPTLVAPTLEAIAQDSRWKSHEDLRVRVASHPGVTLQTAERIARTLSASARQRLLRRPGLHEALRTKLLGR